MFGDKLRCISGEYNIKLDQDVSLDASLQATLRREQVRLSEKKHYMYVLQVTRQTQHHVWEN